MDGGGYLFPVAAGPDELARYALNDFGNAQRLIRQIGGVFQAGGGVETAHCRLLHLRERGWIAFAGTHWSLTAGEEFARREAHKVSIGLIAQGPFKPDSVTGKGWVDFVVRSGNSGSSGAMLAQAAAYLTVGPEAFDTDPLAVNCRNGVLRFGRDKDGKPRLAFDRAHHAQDRFSRLAEVDYDAKAVRPVFDAFLEQIQPRPEMRDYLAKVLGYAATGETREQAFFILQGKGGDGKSTLINAVRDLLGGYAVSSAVETFLDAGARRAGDASPELARLAGDTRMVCTAEPPGGAKLASAAIKTFTGGGRVAARELRQGIFEFSPVCKILLECNRRPSISDIDDGIWRRLRIVMFERQVAEAAIDRDLPRKLEAERAGLLNWLTDGVLAWMADGLDPPEAVRAAGDDYRRGANPFGDWFRERCVAEADHKIRAKDLFDDYKAWCEAQGHERPMTQTTFGRALGDLQVIRAGKDGSGAVLRKGVRLRPSWEDEAGGGAASFPADDPFSAPAAGPAP